MHLTLELTRPDDRPVAIPGVVTYSLRLGPAQQRSLALDWDAALLQDLQTLRDGRADEEAQARVGERLRALLEQADWSTLEQQLDRALFQGEPVQLTILAGAPELYALPWELLRLRRTGEPLFRVNGLQLRYAWPGVQGPPKELDLGVQPHDPGTRVLFAWSDAGGAVPADLHRAALHQAWGPERVIELPHATLQAIEDALRATAGEGHPARLLHLLAHGGGEGQQSLRLSGPRPSTPEDLRDALTPFAQQLALVVLSACRSGQSSAPGAFSVGLAEALHRGAAGQDGITDVIAARAPLSVLGSVLLTQTLHPALRRGLAVGEALALAREALSRSHPLDACALQHLHPAEARQYVPPQRLRWTRYTQLQGELELMEREAKEHEKRGRPTPDALRAQLATIKEQMRACNTPQVGDRFGQGRYELITHLATGGFASVWKAWDGQEERHVAIKLLKGRFIGDSERRQRFFRGAERMAMLRAHPGVVPVLDRGDEEDGFCWFGMELMPGGTLQEAVLEGRVREPLRLLLELGEALSYAHAQGLVHRDVKPGNVLLDAAGRPRLTDFDLVKVVDSKTGPATRAGLGSFLFAAPEQSMAADTVDARADIYSLAVTAIFVLDGRSLEGRGAWGPPRLLEELTQPEAVKAVLRKGAAYQREERFESVGAFCEALRGAILGGAAATSAIEPAGAQRATPSATPSATPETTPSAAPARTKTAAPAKTETAAPAKTETAAPAKTETAAPSATPTASAATATPSAATATPSAATEPSAEGSRPAPPARRAATQAHEAPSPKPEATAPAPTQPKPSTAQRSAPAKPPSAPPASAPQQASDAPSTTPARRAPAPPQPAAPRTPAPRADSERRPAGEPEITAQPAETQPETPAAPAELEEWPPRRSPWPRRLAGGAMLLGLATVASWAIGGLGDSTNEATNPSVVGSGDDPSDIAEPSTEPNPLRPGLASIPGGTFQMGSSQADLKAEGERRAYDDERPQRAVTVASFYMCRTEVTQGQYEAVMGKNPGDCNVGCGDDRPVQQVSWFDAVAYLNALTKAENARYREAKEPALTLCYEGSEDAPRWVPGCTGYRLPTEAEWEYAARAGTTTAWSWGDDPASAGDYAWYDGNAGDKVYAVSTKAANPLGLYDMHGNVWEWVWDWYDSYPSEAQVNPTGPETGSDRVLRGGSFWNMRRNLRSADRNGSSPGVRYGRRGFRCARGPGPQP